MGELAAVLEWDCSPQQILIEKFAENGAIPFTTLASTGYDHLRPPGQLAGGISWRLRGNSFLKAVRWAANCEFC